MSSLRLSRCCRLLVVALSIVVTSCSNDAGGAKLVPVKGKITVGDQPLKRGSILFRLQSPAGNAPEPYGSIEPDGSYTMYTNNKPGAPIGKYYAIIEASEEIDPSKPSATPKSLIDAKYADAANKLISIEVVESPTSSQYDIKLSR